MTTNNIEQKEPDSYDLSSPEYFFNRELSWLKFNLRVLMQAERESVPLLERLNFIAITSSNLDEFFMVRVAGLWDLYESGDQTEDAAGLTPREQLRKISVASHKGMELESRVLKDLLMELELRGGPEIRKVKDCGIKAQEWLEEFFDEYIYPVLTPMVVDAARPFPFLANKTLNLAVELNTFNKSRIMGVVQVPSVLPRLVEVPVMENRTFVFLEDIMAYYCSRLFSGCDILDVVPFRITRDSDLNLEETGIDNLLSEVEKSLRERKRGKVRRLEIAVTDNTGIKEFLAENLSVMEEEIYDITGPLDLTCFFSFIDRETMWPWMYEPFKPQEPLELTAGKGIFEQVAAKDILLFHPYESFDPVVKFIADAAKDPRVLAIKQTLYRVGGKSPIVKALAKAAENGKQVTVLVELKARFDEENNILWARRLEKAGAHVIYGFPGFKTHAKITLVVRKEADGIRRYVHMGTGNYNEKTAKLYTDIGLITADDSLGSDASAFFNLLSGFSMAPVWNKLVIAPLDLREKIYELIDREIKAVKEGKEGFITAKMNALLDPPVISKLYEASTAGVKINLIVRGICALRPGIKGVSENIKVRSIIGRQLEHSRIFRFGTGNREQIYLSSADWMPRNLNDRVELFFPIESKEHKDRIRKVLELYLADNMGAHEMQPDGSYVKMEPGREGVRISSQNSLYERAIKFNAGEVDRKGRTFRSGAVGEKFRK